MIDVKLAAKHPLYPTQSIYLRYVRTTGRLNETSVWNVKKCSP